mmetsp:Transcript_21410/g.49831  ORF Transcript_21410/g.49831 Transcript_21410/m.49831 type:complete len:251 (+) Transcript_21410:239-991(+)
MFQLSCCILASKLIQKRYVIDVSFQRCFMHRCVNLLVEVPGIVNAQLFPCRNVPCSNQLISPVLLLFCPAKAVQSAVWIASRVHETHCIAICVSINPNARTFQASPCPSHIALKSVIAAQLGRPKKLLALLSRLLLNSCVVSKLTNILTQRSTSWQSFSCEYAKASALRNWGHKQPSMHRSAVILAAIDTKPISSNQPASGTTLNCLLRYNMRHTNLHAPSPSINCQCERISQKLLNCITCGSSAPVLCQ